MIRILVQALYIIVMLVMRNKINMLSNQADTLNTQTFMRSGMNIMKKSERGNFKLVPHTVFSFHTASKFNSGGKMQIEKIL